MENNNKSFSVSKPLASITIQIDADQVDLLIKGIKEKGNFNLLLGEMVIFSIIKAIKDFPEFNSNFDQELVIYPSINLGHFVNLGDGPKLAVIKDAGTKNLSQVAQEIKESALKYIRGELLDETSLSTVSVTNLFSSQVYQVLPPVYDHQSSMFSIASKFISSDGKKYVNKFNLTLSYDARVADCQAASKFLNVIKKMLEGSTEDLKIN